jgi:hypothetical protein
MAWREEQRICAEELKIETRNIEEHQRSIANNKLKEHEPIFSTGLFWREGIGIGIVADIRVILEV